MHGMKTIINTNLNGETLDNQLGAKQNLKSVTDGCTPKSGI